MQLQGKNFKKDHTTRGLTKTRSSTKSITKLQIDLDSNFVEGGNLFAEHFSKQQIKNIHNFHDVVTFYQEANVNQKFAKLETIFNYSVPYYSIFYYWFTTEVRDHCEKKIRLKSFSDHFFNYLANFGYKKTSITKVKKAILFLAPLKLKVKEIEEATLLKPRSIERKSLKAKEFRLNRRREGLQFEGLFLKSGVLTNKTF